MWYSCTKRIIITNQAMNNDKFRRFCEFQIKNISLSHKFLGNNRISYTIVIYSLYCTADFIKKIDFVQRRHHRFLMDYIWIRTYDAFLAKSMVLIKSAVQYNNSTTDSVVALYRAHLHVITPIKATKLLA